MALILGIYERLIAAIRSLARPEVWRPLLKGRVREAAVAADLAFLIAVLVGVAAGILTFARLLGWLLDSEPVLVWSLFFGLVLASIYVVARKVKRRSIKVAVAAVAGGVGAFFLVGAVPAQTPDALWFVFLSGALAICAMILPGISGAFVLLILGKYEYVLEALNNGDIGVIAVFALGALLGLISFAQLLGWLFRRFHDGTVALLIGLMAGSLRKIWPWKETVATITTPSGEVVPTEQVNILPQGTIDGVFNLEILWAVLLALFGAALVVGFDLIGRRRGQRLRGSDDGCVDGTEGSRPGVCARRSS